MPSWMQAERWLGRCLNPWGIVGAVILFIVALSPSLIPRGPLYQGLLCGILAAMGYGLGLLVRVTAVRWVLPRLPEVSQRYRVWFGAVCVVCGVAVVWGTMRRQEELAYLVGVEPLPRPAFLLVVPVGFCVMVVTMSIGSGVGRLARWISGHVPGSPNTVVRTTLAWGCVVMICLFAVDTVIPGAIVGAGEALFSRSNDRPEEGVGAPVEKERSGSPDSLADFAGLGSYGMRLVDGGLRGPELAELIGRPAKEPIRVFAGLRNREDVTERADLLIDELERTRATDREALLVVMPTGTGWVNLATAQAFEILHGGDTAVAAVQYSYLPSALHFLGGGESVQEAGREILTRVVDWWNGLPEDHRPQLYLYGESLGSTAVEAGFSGIRDIITSVDGVFLAGPPSFNPIRGWLIDHRDPGSTEVAPSVQEGKTVRFAATIADIKCFYGGHSDSLPEGASPAAARQAAHAEWGPGRVLYLQHASDPVVWWSPSLMFQEPDWLREKPGEDRLRQLSWLPFVTFLQVASDLPVSQENVAPGHGHDYSDSFLHGFAALAAPGTFTVEEVDELEPLLVEALERSGDHRFDRVGISR